jgi:hypothetical protein
MRAISRVCDVSLNTVDKLLVDTGNACAAFHAATVVAVKAKRVQCDEIWSFCYSKQSNTPAEGSRIIGADSQGFPSVFNALSATGSAFCAIVEEALEGDGALSQPLWYGARA